MNHRRSSGKGGGMGGIAGADDSNSSSASSFLKSLKQLDAYAKPLDDFRVKTSTGAAVSIISYVLIAILLVSEFTDWRTVQVLPSLDVDKSRKDKMWINLNMTFPKVPCFLLSIDVMDVSGDHQNDVDHSIIKTRIDRNGNVIHAAPGVIGEKVDEKAVAQKDPNYCGSCYGGVPPENGCCNTCEDVRRAYTNKGWSFTKPDDVEQCVNEGWSEKMKEQATEGCNMSGHIEVNKVAGNFHFAPGKSFQQGGVHVHDLASYQAENSFDFSHTIHQLSFGKVTNFKNPLDGHTKFAEKGHYMYQYFVKVVSTKFKYLDGREVNTNQIAVTEHERDTTLPGAGLPGVFFNFDISPMLVTYNEYQKPFAHFLTDVCAIVGGIFTVAGILDSIIYTAEKNLKKKIELGKAS
ncbi:endoplasmic reticulum vesicle transporter-domain-containing protein [Zopfochytrium polystomum]|nr:endoplasmic reticulum vesicle transporter-domain-containing protein [Zopfochytrium polystomum]